MKKLFLTTAILTLSTLGGTSFAFANTADTLSQVEFTKVYKIINTTSIAVDLQRGDFQIFAKAINEHHLYNGTGSALMKTMRIARY